MGQRKISHDKLENIWNKWKQNHHIANLWFAANAVLRKKAYNCNNCIKKSSSISNQYPKLPP